MKIIRVHFDSIDSTQNWALEHAKQFEKDALTVVTANTQTAGRGRRSNLWHSPAQGNIYLTYSFCLEKKRDFCSISLMLAVVTAQVLKSLGFAPQIKWPNDILLCQHKTAGILAETRMEKDYIRVFLGIGINVNMEKKECEQIDKAITSLKIVSHKSFDPQDIITKLNTAFILHYPLFAKDGFTPFLKDFETFCIHHNQHITIHDGHQEWQGLYQRVTNQGYLCLKLSDGSIKDFANGTILHYTN